MTHDEPNHDGGAGHPTELLAAYAAGAAPAPGQAGELAAHVDSCARCAAEVESWRSVAGAVRERAAQVPRPGPTLWAAIRERLAVDEPQARRAPATLNGTSTGTSTGTAADTTTGVTGLTGVTGAETETGAPYGIAGAPRYGPATGGRPLARVAGIFAHQWRLIRWPVWAGAAAILTAATALAAMAPAGNATRLLALVVPLVAAMAVGVACGSDADPAAELVRATPTSTRAVLLARLTLVLGGVVAGGMVASAVLALGVGVPGATVPAGGSGPYGDGEPLAEMFSLVATWFGPLVPLTAVSFALSVCLRPAAGVGAAMALWMIRALSGSSGVGPLFGRLVEPVWSPDVAVLAGAVALLVATVVAAPRLPLRLPRTG